MEVRMDTKLATRQFRISQWSGIIQDRINSGMKVDDYCEEHQISKNAYYYWLRKVREYALESSDVQFADLSNRQASKSFCCTSESESAVSINYNGVIIGVNESASSDLLRRVIGVIADVT